MSHSGNASSSGINPTHHNAASELATCPSLSFNTLLFSFTDVHLEYAPEYQDGGHRTDILNTDRDRREQRRRRRENNAHATCNLQAKQLPRSYGSLGILVLRIVCKSCVSSLFWSKHRVFFLFSKVLMLGFLNWNFVSLYFSMISLMQQ